VVSAALVVLALRTRLPLYRSRPGRALMTITLLMAVVAVLLPYTPLAAPLGFKPLPLLYLLAIAAITLVYVASAELVKRWFYRHYGT